MLLNKFRPFFAEIAGAGAGTTGAALSFVDHLQVVGVLLAIVASALTIFSLVRKEFPNWLPEALRKRTATAAPWEQDRQEH